VLKCNPSDPTNWTVLAPLLIQQGDLKSYRAHRRDMLARFGSVANALVAERIAQAALLLPAESNELTVAGRLAQQAMANGTNMPSTFQDRLQRIVQRAQTDETNRGADATNAQETFGDRLNRIVTSAETNAPPHSSLPSSRSVPFLFLAGLANYREGRWAATVEALERLGAGLRYSPWLARSGLEAQRCFLLALALYRDNRVDEARQALASGVEFVQTKLPALSSGDLGASWEQVLVAQVLMREAREQVKPAGASQASTAADAPSRFHGRATNSPTVKFGGPPWCYYRQTISNIIMTAFLREDIVTSSVTCVSFEEPLDHCTTLHFPTQAQLYSSDGGIFVSNRVTMNFAAHPTNAPACALTFTGTLQDTRFLSGTLVWRRIDQSAPLDWRISADIALQPAENEHQRTE
jgi:hypothetical protein